MHLGLDKEEHRIGYGEMIKGDFLSTEIIDLRLNLNDAKRENELTAVVRMKPLLCPNKKKLVKY